MKYRSLLSVTVLAAGLAVGACSSDSSDDGSGAGGSGATGGGTGDDCGGRAETFSAGMSKTSDDGSVTVAIQSSDPAPPDRGQNKWMLQITDASGNGIEGASIDVKTWMPDHGHGANEELDQTTEMGGGAYEVDPVVLFMPGFWEITVSVTPVGGEAQSVMFAFCAQG